MSGKIYDNKKLRIDPLEIYHYKLKSEIKDIVKDFELVEIAKIDKLQKEVDDVFVKVIDELEKSVDDDDKYIKFYIHLLLIYAILDARTIELDVNLHNFNIKLDGNFNLPILLKNLDNKKIKYEFINHYLKVYKEKDSGQEV